MNMKDQLAMQAMYASGAFSKAPERITRESIATMGKPDVAELLDFHGVEFDGRAKVGDLRDLLAKTMFIEVGA